MSPHAAAPEQVPTQDGFFPAACNSMWYENLKRRGSCIELLGLLREVPTLIHELGPEDMTALHKGVRHGCVELVRFILVNMFDHYGYCKCSRHGRHGAGDPALTREELLRRKCSYGSTAVNMAVVSGSPRMVVLLEWAIETCRSLTGQTSQEMPSEEFEDMYEYRNPKTIFFHYEQRMSRVEEMQTGSTYNIEYLLPVPEVTDLYLNMLYSCSSDVKGRVYSVIHRELEVPGDEHRQWMDMVKTWFEKDVDFEFVPLVHVFLHFLYSVPSAVEEERAEGGLGFYLFREGVTKRIFEACFDGELGETGATLKALFNILDPRGRTFLHVAFELGFPRTHHTFHSIEKQLPVNISPAIKAECLNAKDGAGRSIFHLMGAHNIDPCMCLFELEKHIYIKDLALNRRLSSPQDQKLNVLKRWCFPFQWNPIQYRLTPLDFAVLVDSRKYLESFWHSDGSAGISTCIGEGEGYESCTGCTLLQLAAALGRAAIIETMLKYHLQSKSFTDPGLGSKNMDKIPALHYAAYYGQVQAIQSIMKFPIYDPMVQHSTFGTALHLLLDKQQSEMDVNGYHNALLCHMLPKSSPYKLVKKDFFKLPCKEEAMPILYSSDKISCINLLLQAGIDIWTPHILTKELPSLGPMINDETRKWWYEKVVNEVVALKSSVSYAANATSVVAALVATVSFIGPFQPPLGYGDLDGFVRTNQSPLRVYLVCNSLSFYFSIASILMALLPAILISKESLYDELLRSQRCLKSATMLLLFSIICLLISFSSASMAVVSPEWHERRIVVSYVIFGGAICVVVLIIYIIRLLRMLFHRNNRFRRIFARHMYF